jgi:hypothetical protein
MDEKDKEEQRIRRSIAVTGTYLLEVQYIYTYAHTHAYAYIT